MKITEKDIGKWVVNKLGEFGQIKKYDSKVWPIMVEMREEDTDGNIHKISLWYNKAGVSALGSLKGQNTRTLVRFADDLEVELLGLNDDDDN